MGCGRSRSRPSSCPANGGQYTAPMQLLHPANFQVSGIECARTGFKWLVGPMEIEQIEVQHEGATRTWSSDVKIKKCRYLEATACAGEILLCPSVKQSCAMSSSNILRSTCHDTKLGVSACRRNMHQPVQGPAVRLQCNKPPLVVCVCPSEHESQQWLLKRQSTTSRLSMNIRCAAANASILHRDLWVASDHEPKL